mgnify:CR=1 FL=1
MRGEGETLASLDVLCGRSGYVIAPFAIDSQTPLVLIRPEVHLRFDSPEAIDEQVANMVDSIVPARRNEANEGLPTNRKTYSTDFALFHSHLVSGEFSKIVLSRHAEAAITRSPMDMFRRACDLYPRMFITLFASPWSGAWMVATPEILLEAEGGEWRTIALAGTMPLSEDGEGAWSDKNIREQRYVATYIGDRVRRFAKDLQESGPRTVRAGHLMHLRSDFTFSTADTNIGALLSALHPTPAVCGLPKEEARAFILKNEHCQRRYYSGFCGPMAMDGATHLFVTLRCMSLTDRRLYAGGGLLSESDEQAEWDETEAKMATMRALTQ